MELVDVEALKGERVFVEVDCDEGKAYVGTLHKILERSISLKDWILVEEWDASHILVYTNGAETCDSWNGDLHLNTVGMLREVRRIEKNHKRGDPHVNG